MTNQKQPQIHPSLVEFANAALTGRLPRELPNVASVMAESVGAERDRRVTELETKIRDAEAELSAAREIVGGEARDLDELRAENQRLRNINSAISDNLEQLFNNIVASKINLAGVLQRIGRILGKEEP